jgi:uroporphyrinogen-III decarboxylase
VRHSLTIDYPVEKMADNRRRMDARGKFRYFDRAPVGFCVVPRYFAPLFGLRYHEFFRQVETQFHWQLQFFKYRIENIPEDIACHAPVVHVAPYFDNVVNASAFGAEIVRPENETLHARPLIKTVEEMERLEIPAPDAGLWGTVIEWWQRMTELARETKAIFNGIEGRVEVAPPAIGGEGPHMIAIDLVGEDFYWWMLEYPEACHRFLRKITLGMIQAERRFRKLAPRPRGGYGIAEDSAQIMSADLFIKFCVPYDNMLYDEFGAGLADGRGMHMCGDSRHLHRALVEHARISSFNVFGYQVPPRTAAENLGGKMYLWGNVNPMLIRNGSREQVKAAARECLEAMAPCGGFLLGDGANICPGTPLANLAVFTEAAQEYGVPPSVGDGPPTVPKPRSR